MNNGLADLLKDLPPDANYQMPDPSLLVYYKERAERVFYITYEIDDSLYGLVQSILQINRDDKDIDPNERKPIRIVIASPGGMLEMGETLAQVIKLSLTPVYTIALGMVASASSIVYLAGKRKYATKNAQWLLHQGSCEGVSGNYDDVQRFMENYKKEIDELHKYYIENTKYTEDEINEGLRNDWYISIDEALEKGIVDEVITDLEILM